ncbi:MAG TPA: sugar phosphate isomerase/epimerase [Armatimonadetes bacterium]|nr:sugar phosphate isomerase/epimerase [Armatimonadota bacterium]
MRDSWRHRCLVSTVLFMSFPKATEDPKAYIEGLETVATDDFFTAVEVTKLDDDEARRDAVSIVKSAGLEVIFGAQYVLLSGGLNLNALDESERRRAVDAVKACFEQAVEFGAKVVAVLSGPDPGEGSREEAKGALVRSLVELCKEAPEGVWISLENFDREVDKKCLIGPTAEAAEVAGKVKEEAPNIGLTVDLSHLPLLGEEPEESISTAFEHLIHVHIGNCVKGDPSHPAYGDKHPRFGIEGGENDVRAVHKFFQVLYYSGYFTKDLPTRLPVIGIEVKPMEGECPEVVLANSKRVFKEAWARLVNP